jgi:hypothetical protein
MFFEWPRSEHPRGSSLLGPVGDSRQHGPNHRQLLTTFEKSILNIYKFPKALMESEKTPVISLLVEQNCLSTYLEVHGHKSRRNSAKMLNMCQAFEIVPPRGDRRVDKFFDQRSKFKDKVVSMQRHHFSVKRTEGRIL